MKLVFSCVDYTTTHPSTGVIVISNCTLQCNQHYNPDLLLYVHGSHLCSRRLPPPLNIKSCPGLCNIRCIAASDIMHHQFEFATLSSSFRNPPLSPLHILIPGKSSQHYVATTFLGRWYKAKQLLLVHHHCTERFPICNISVSSSRPLPFIPIRIHRFNARQPPPPLSVNSVINENPNSVAAKTFNWARDDMNKRVDRAPASRTTLS